MTTNTTKQPQKRPLPPLLEGWIKDLQDKNVNVFVRENSMRELQEIRDQIDTALRTFNNERARVMADKRRPATPHPNQWRKRT
jgi:hypothetical protein